MMSNNENKVLGSGISEKQIEDLKDEVEELREFIKNISNQKGNIDVKMINNGVEKTLPMYVDERIYKTLQKLVGEENVSIMLQKD